MIIDSAESTAYDKSFSSITINGTYFNKNWILCRKTRQFWVMFKNFTLNAKWHTFFSKRNGALLCTIDWEIQIWDQNLGFSSGVKVREAEGGPTLNLRHNKFSKFKNFHWNALIFKHKLSQILSVGKFFP